jgi:acyl transferase domain-containing protein/NADPH:quinone reductase-like Zn-dependent oxidoreductase/SAM-dependent methyltransferase/aryl carrier-like protein
VPAESISYVEAHGTATALGDPLEIAALTRVFRETTARRGYCAVGSVKSNVGHLEAAAGVTGLIKTVLALQHRQIPASLHYETPNPRIDFSSSPFFVNTALRPWESEGPRRAGVNSLGIGGTNAHLILEESPVPAAAEPAQNGGSPYHLLCLSAREPAALDALAERYAGALEAEDAPALADAAHTTRVARTPFLYRRAVVARDAADAARQLRESAEEVDSRAGDPPRIAFLCTGQGAQVVGMGRDLYEREAVFREVLDRCDAILREGWDLPLLSILYPQEGEAGAEDAAAERLQHTATTQPALFALEVALGRLWRSWGIEPVALLGHSVGEYAAACLAGVFSLEDGLRLIAERGRLVGSLPPGGAMAALFAPEARVREGIAPFGEALSVAALNAPTETVVSGEASAVEAALEQFAADGIKGKPLAVSHAFHSHRLEPVLEAFAEAAGRVTYRLPALPVVSNRTGEVAGDEIATAEYWVRHLREAVRFMPGMAALTAEGIGCDTFLEIGPKPTLVALGRRCLGESAEEGGQAYLWLPSLRPGRDDHQQMLETVGALFRRGLPPKLWNPGGGGRRVALPTYPFQRQRHWLDPLPVSAAGGAPLAGPPLLGRQLRSPLFEGAAVFESELSVAALPFLDDHRVWGRVVVPGACHVAMALAAARALDPPAPWGVAEVAFPGAVSMGDREAKTAQLLLEGETAGGRSARPFRLMTLGDDDAWVLHASGELTGGDLSGGSRASGALSPAAPPSPEALRERYTETLSGETFYRWFEAERRIELGPGFHWIQTLHRGTSAEAGAALARMRAPRPEEAAGGYPIYPALVDACFQLLMSTLTDEVLADPEAIYVPFGVDRFVLHETAGDRPLWCHARLRRDGEQGQQETFTGDITLWADDGSPVATITALHLKRATREGMIGTAGAPWQEWLYEVGWQRAPLKEGRAAEVLPDPAALAAALAPEAERQREIQTQEGYRHLWPQLDRLCAQYAVRALKSLGWSPEAGQKGTVASLAASLGVEAHHHRLLHRLLGFLAEEGWLRVEGDAWHLENALPAGAVADPTAHHRELVAAFPACGAELALTGRAGEALASILRGEGDPLEVLFPEGDLTSATDFYRHSPSTRVVNPLLRESFARLAEAGSGRPLRVLEIGAGTGGATAHVLPALASAGAGVEYTFTDVGSLFLARARENFADYPFVRYQQLDMEREPETQGLAAGTFDVVLAANVLHATRNLERTMERVHRLLAPGGVLVLQEAFGLQRWLDLVFGLTEGWWLYEDAERRSDNPLLTPEGWQELLPAVGFGPPEVLPAAEDGEATHQGLLLARVPRAEDAPRQEARGGWILLADEASSAGVGGVGEVLAEALEAAGGTVVTVVPGETTEPLEAGRWCLDLEDENGPARLLAASPEGGWRGVVHLWGVEATAAEPADEPGALLRAQRLGVGAALSWVRTLAGWAPEDGSPAPGLWLVTRGTQAVGGEALPVQVTQAPLWGLGRVIDLEHRELGCVRIDLDLLPHPEEGRTLAREILHGDPVVADQVVLRGPDRYVARLERHAGGEVPPAVETAPRELIVEPKGTLDNIQLRPLERRAPGPGEVEIRVRASGLNFLDVMDALGVLPFERGWFGVECAGEITALGEGAAERAPAPLEVGQPVIAVAFGTFRSHVVARAELVVPKPANLSFHDAAGVPVTYLTAHASLSHHAGMGAGESVLVHAAAGGVGLAALQLARRAGAEVWGSAGSPAKRHWLRSLGVQQVVDSRSLGFAEEVLRRTDGRGVDLVLNSLAGDFIPEGLRALAPGGRFVEIGKTGIWTEEQVRDFRDDVRYVFYDLVSQCREVPATVGAQLLEVLEGFEEGSLYPVPRRVLPLERAAEGFRSMAQARHVGKILFRSHPGRWRGPRADAAYLITGGLGGLGLAVARWLVAGGARHLVLTGRKPPGAEAVPILEALREEGATVRVVTADVARWEDMESCFATLDAEGPPLAGVFHAAGVLADGVLLHQDWSRFERVLAPKVEGAWNLHRLTRDRELDAFVLFSSIASVFGSAGQSNHAAANAFLDALAHHRRALGLPGLSINWGSWAEIGAAAGEEWAEHLQQLGLGRIPPADGLAVLDRLLMTDAVQVAVTPVNWETFHRRHGEAEPALFHGLADTAAAPRRTAEAAVASTAAAATAGPALPEQIAGLTAGEQRKEVLAHVRGQVARILGLDDPAALDARHPLAEMGVDSLMAVELRNALRRSVGKSLAPTLLYQHPTLEALTDYLLTDVLREAPGSDGNGKDSRPDAPAPTPNAIDEAALDGLEDGAVEELLARELAALSGDLLREEDLQ